MAFGEVHIEGSVSDIANMSTAYMGIADCKLIVQLADVVLF